LPLALFMMMAIALLTALLLDGAVQELRSARGDVAAMRAEAAAGTALADLLASRPDSALLASPRGAVATGSVAAGADTTRLTIQSLGNGMLRVTAGARAWSGGVRGDASTLGYVRIGPDSSGPPGTLRFRRLPGWWWSQLP
jgi:hypothetical protein